MTPHTDSSYSRFLKNKYIDTDENEEKDREVKKNIHSLRVVSNEAINSSMEQRIKKSIA
jgi:hypothetical protein